MENYSYNSYPDSHDSSPRSREIDCENASWTDEQQLNYKVKFMCSYGGKIQPRPHDNQLTYVGGDTKILSVDRNIKFAGIISKLSSLCDFDVYFKYQLPGEDLDALISVTNDEDLEHMMIEYDRLLRGSTKPARLRLFLFSLNPSSPSNFSETSESNKTNQSWFVDALNSVPIQSLDVTSPPAPPTGIPPNTPDFLFGFDKGQAQAQAQAQTLAQAQAQVQLQSPLMVKQQEPERELPVPEQSPRKNMSGSDSGKDDRQIGGETMVSRADIQRQISELQRMQIANANHEQAMFQRQTDEMLARAFPGDYYMQQQNKVPDKVAAMAAAAAVATAVPVPSPVQTVPTPTNVTAVPTGYWPQQPERHVATGGYPVAPTGGEQQQQLQQQQRPVYLVPAPTSMYQTQPVTGPVGQGYYGMQRMMQDVYREQPVYGMGPPPQQQAKIVGGYGEGVSIVRPPASGIPVAESGYTQMAYDSAGRQVYYTTAPGGGVVPTSFQTVPAVDGRQAGGQLNQEGKVIKPSQPQI